MKVVKIYICPNCESYHYSERDAETCCKPDKAWLCGKCNEIYTEEAQAIICCQKDSGFSVASSLLSTDSVPPLPGMGGLASKLSDETRHDLTEVVEREAQRARDGL